MEERITEHQYPTNIFVSIHEQLRSRYDCTDCPLFIVSLLPEGTNTQSTYAGLMVAIVSATSTFSAVYLGRLGDRIGHRQTLIASALLATAFYIPQTFVTNVWQLLVLQAFTGIALGGIIAAPSALLAVYSEHGNEGAVYGLDNSLIAASRAVAPLSGSFLAYGLECGVFLP